MSIGARISAWWASTKVIVLLGAALAGSLALNYWQHRQAITAPLRAQVADLKGALEDSAALQTAVRESTERLQGAADDASRQLASAGTRYQRAMRERPITDPQCAPGQGRQDAVNRALGAQPEGEP